MPEILEKELEDYLYNLGVNNPFDVYGKIFRQINIQGYGTIDLLTVDLSWGGRLPFVMITIIELKKEEIDLTAIGQISRYKIAIERYLKQLEEKGRIKLAWQIQGILVGKEYAGGDVCFVVDSIDWLSSYIYKLSLEKGLELNISEGWFNKAENFKSLDIFAKQFFPEYIEYYKHYSRYNKTSKLKAV